MKKYIKYIIISFMMFFSFSNGINAEQMRICSYEFKNYWQVGKHVYVNVYVTENGVSAYYSDKSFLLIGETNSKQLSPQFSKKEFMSGNIATSACPKTVSIPPYDLLNQGKVYLGMKLGYVSLPNSGSDLRDFDNVIPSPGDVPEILDPPGSGESIFTGSCPSDSSIISLIGNFYSILKIATPIALVIFGMIDFAKAVMSSDEAKMKKSQSAFVRRIIAAVVVLLVMSLVSLLSGLIPSESGIFSCVEQILS